MTFPPGDPVEGRLEVTAMNCKLFVVGVFLIVLGLGVLAGGVQAQAPYFWNYGGCGYGYGYGPWGGYNGQAPYFAWNPPVYYSYPVAYPYGYSPYPNPPYAIAAEAPGVSVAASAASPAQQPPLRIANPYVTQGEGSKTDSGARTANPPKVVYPAAMAQAK
jgi:hypothetical protein